MATPNHPFYVDKLGWTLAKNLRAGDILVLSNGEFVVVEWIQHEVLESPIKVYNFEVQDFHTYFVGESSVLVHNMCTPINNSSKSAKGLVGKDFEDYLTNEIGGNGSFSMGGRDFDGGVGNRWWEAKSGQYWDLVMNNPKKMDLFKSSMGDRLRIARDNGATYELFSNTAIPQLVKDWLNKKGIPFTEILY